MTPTQTPYTPDLDHEIAWAMRATLREMLPAAMVYSCEIADDPDADIMRVRIRFGPRESTAKTTGGPECAAAVAEFELHGQGQMWPSEWNAYVRREMRGWFREAARTR